MTEDIAELILEHGEDIFPYLRIRAEYCKNGSKGKVLLDSSPDLAILERGGFIKTEEKDGFVEVTVYDTPERWLYQPKELKKKIKEREEYIPKALAELVEMVGYPLDWLKNPAKYRSLFIRAKNKHGYQVIKRVAEDALNKDVEVSLPALLSDKGFHFYQNLPEKPTFQDRTTASDYKEEQIF